MIHNANFRKVSLLSLYPRQEEQNTVIFLFFLKLKKLLHLCRRDFIKFAKHSTFHFYFKFEGKSIIWKLKDVFEYETHVEAACLCPVICFITPPCSSRQSFGHVGNHFLVLSPQSKVLPSCPHLSTKWLELASYHVVVGKTLKWSLT